MVSTPHRASPRIAPLAAADASPEAADVFAKTLGSETGEPLNIFATLAHQPRLLKRFNLLGGLFLAHGELPDRERELVILRTAWRSRSPYEWGQHVLIGRRVGVTDDEIDRVVLPVDDNDAGWSADDAALLRFTDELLDDVDVRDATWDAVRRHWSESQMLELVMLIGFYRMVAGFLNTVGVQPEGDLPPLPGHV